MRYSLQTLLLAVAVVASATAAFGVVGFVAALIGLGLAAFVAAAKTKLEAMLIATIVVVLVLLLLPAFETRGPHPPWVSCHNNLKQIALAIHNYHDVHGCLPPAYLPDQDGKPMHSWRVLILPYMEESDLYAQYDFSEPWDGPNNRRLAPQMPYVYRCCGKRFTATSVATDFVAVTGPWTVWSGTEPVRLDDIPDGTDYTLLVVEIADSNVNWMEPRDISFEELLADIDREKGSALLSPHERGPFMNRWPFAPVAFADGHCRYLDADVDPKMLEALLTADGGEVVEEARLDLFTGGRHRQGRSPWPRRLAVLALFLSIALLVGRPWLKAVRRRRAS